MYRNQDVEFEKELKNAKIQRKIRVEVLVKDGFVRLIDENNVRLEKALQLGETPLNQEKANDNFIKQFQKTGEADFIVNSIRVKDDLMFYPVSMINEFRRECFEELMQLRLVNYRQKIQGEINYAQYPEDELDYRANVFNSKALEFYNESLCEIKEFAFEKTAPKQAELMRTKHCIKWALGMCKSPENLFLIDEKGVKYPLKFDCKNCEMAILKP